MTWTAFIILAIGLFCGYMAGSASQKRKHLREARVWEMLVDAGRRNSPITTLQLSNQTELGFGSLYPLLSRLEKQEKIVRIRKTKPDGEYNGTFYMANVNPKK
jgi:hypothetical protein